MLLALLNAAKELKVRSEIYQQCFRFNSSPSVIEFQEFLYMQGIPCISRSEPILFDFLNRVSPYCIGYFAKIRNIRAWHNSFVKKKKIKNLPFLECT